MPTILERFVAGELPEEFIEQQEIIPPDHPVAVDFAAQAAPVMRRLFGNDYDPAIHNFRYLLSTQDGPNAFVIPQANPPIFCFTVDLLKLLPTEDHFAAILTHELGHERLHQRLGEHDNSKLEEQGSDIAGVLRLQDSGYRPRATAEALAALPQRAGLRKIENYMDVHTGGQLRVRLAEDAVVVLINLRGAENTAPTPFHDEAIWESFRNFKQARYMEKLLSERGFAAADNTGKINIIRHILETEELNPDDSYRSMRAIDLIEAVKSIKLDPGHAAEVAAFTGLADQLIVRQKNYPFGWARMTGELCPVVYKTWKDSGLTGLPGQIGVLTSAMRGFIHASSHEDATAAARALRLTNEAIDIDLPRDSGNNRIIEEKFLPTFPLPTDSELTAVTEARREGNLHTSIPLSWKRHVGWARTDRDNNSSPDIQIALAQMGITREYGLVEVRYTQPTLTHQMYGYESDYSTFTNPLVVSHDLSRALEGLVVSDELDTFGYRIRERFWPAFDSEPSPELAQRLLDSETERMARRDARGAEAATEADWSLLERPGRIDDFDRIVRETGYADGSWRLNEELKKLDWYGSYRDTYSARRERVLEFDEHNKHSCQINHFFEKHRHLLTPELSVVGGGATFERAFAERLKALAAQHPDIYAPMIRQFFNHFFSGYSHELPPVSIGPNNSLHTLLADTIAVNSREGVGLNERFVAGMRLGIDPDHPYMSLVTDPVVALLPEHRIEFLANTRYLKEDKTLSATNLWHFDPVAALGLKPIQNATDFNDRYKAAKRFGYDILESSHSKEKAAYFLSEVMATEVHQYLANTARPFSRDEMVALEQASRFGLLSEILRDTRDLLDDAFVKSARHELASNPPTMELAESYVQFSHYALFLNNPELRHQYEQEITQRLNAITDPAAKRAVTEKILLTRDLTPELLPAAGASRYKSAIADPDFRKTVSDAYVDSLVQLYGKDDGQPAFEATATALIDNIAQQTEGTTRFGILSGLASRMGMQKELSFYVRDKIVDAELMGMKRQDGKIAFGEASIDLINQSMALTRATIDFIRAPLTRESASRYVQVFKDQNVFSALLPRTAQILAEKLKAHGGSINPDVEIDAATQAHRNFWSMPLGVRTLYFDKIVFPINAPDAFEANKKLVLDLAVPLPPATPPEKPGLRARARNIMRRLRPPAATQAEIAHDFVESYAAVSTESEQRLFLTALLVANEPSAKTSGLAEGNFGKSLRHILYALGPAGVKTAQAIHSHPATPEWLRKDMGESKFAADKPFQWDVHKLVAANGLEERIAHVGPVLGAGAYGITIKTDRTDGTNTATTFLRPHVRERAEREFSVLADAVQHFLGKHPNFSPVLDMIQQARSMAKVETDMDLAAKQAIIAQDHYDNVVIVADGKRFVFGTAPWLEHGPDYKETGIVEGAHFNDLPSGSGEDAAYQRASAKALLTIEQKALLSGKPFDHDRHGGQQKLQGAIIGQFDHGAMALEPPTDKQKKLLGRVLGAALRQHALSRSRVSVADALVHQLDSHCKTSGEALFLTEVKRAFLAQSDFRKVLSPDEAKAVIAAVWTAPDVDPLIRHGMTRGLGVMAPLVMRALRKHAQKANVEILQERAMPAPPLRTNMSGLINSTSNIKDIRFAAKPKATATQTPAKPLRRAARSRSLRSVSRAITLKSENSFWITTAP